MSADPVPASVAARAPAPSKAQTAGVYLMFAASGAAALIYQILWARWLSLGFGNTTLSISIVLGSFMLGLALGSWLAGARLERVADPMLAYVALEIGIGAFALFFPLVGRLVQSAFAALVEPGSAPLLSTAVKALLALAVLAVPTTLMGATLPMLTEFFCRSPRHGRGWKVGLLYGANTFGAAAGTIAASFFLIELIGVRATTLVAALLNFAVAWVGYRFSRATTVLPAGAAPVAGARLEGDGRLALVVLAAGGGTALASEVLWTRVLETLIGNSTYAFALILVVYLGGIAAGSWVMSLVVGALRFLPGWLVGLQLAMGIWTIGGIRLFRALGVHLATFNFTMVPVSRLLLHSLEAASLLLPLAFASGAVFPVATRILDPRCEDAQGRSIARAYAWNTIGALLGSLLAGFGIAAFFDYFSALYAVAGLYGLTALGAAAALAMGRPERRAAVATLLAAAAALVAVAAAGTRQAGRLAFDGPTREVVFHRPGIQGVTTVVRERGAPLADSLLVNGKGMTVKITDTKTMAHLPMLIHPAPEKTLVICFGMGTTYRSAISHGGEVTVVELVAEVLAAFDHFFADAERVRAYPRGRMVVDDGRNFLLLTRERYDVITIDPPPPIDGAGVNHLYSRELLELARDRLDDDGIMAHWIPLPGSLAGVDDGETFEMLLATFIDVFPHAAALRGFHGVGVHVLGSSQPIELDRERLAARLAAPAVAEDVGEWDAVPLEYFLGLKRLEPLAEPGRVTDDRPRLEFGLLRAWRAGTLRAHPWVHWQPLVAPPRLPT